VDDSLFLADFLLKYMFFLGIMGDGDSEGENLMKLGINHHQQKKEILIVDHLHYLGYVYDEWW